MLLPEPPLHSRDGVTEMAGSETFLAVSFSTSDETRGSRRLGFSKELDNDNGRRKLCDVERIGEWGAQSLGRA
jgi:hypothetical protein